MKLSKAQNILYHIVRSAFYVVSLLPLRALYVFSDMVYPFVYTFYRRKLVRRQLTECFPEKSLGEIKQVERAFYHQFCDLFVETIKQFSMSREEMMRRMVFTDCEEAFAGFNSEQSILFMMLGHFGNWEWIASLQYWTPGVHCSQVYHPLNNDVFDRLFLDLREQYGGECIAMRKTVRRLLQLSGGGKPVICGMIADQQPRWDAIHHFSPFLGHDTAVFIGTEQMAKKLNSLVYYGSVTRVRRGYYVCRAIPITTRPNELSDYEITDRYMQLLEADIRQHPELWLWTHKRWTRTKEEWEERQA
jgi:KDO2-lipid IV(A) lauroyltransferase